MRNDIYNPTNIVSNQAISIIIFIIYKVNIQYFFSNTNDISFVYICS